MFLLGFLFAGCISSHDSSITKAVSITVDEKMIISAPKGFCVDQKMVDKTSDAITLFVIDCISTENSIEKVFARRPISTVMTATIIGPLTADLTSVESLRTFFTTQPGINYLSRSETNKILKLHVVEEINNILLFLVEQRPTDINFTQSSYYWRAFFIHNKKIISLTASNFSEDKYSRKRLRKLILEFSRNILLANSK
tara:strand:- start:542 stop:1135 length:594 start_codon:yes stop_codon:yes gene_type:complete